jgi:hypothetical protein
MKKIIYTAILLTVLSLSFTACTEENVKPAGDPPTNGGGTGSDDPFKK